MAEKLIQTRIISKHADLSAWSTSELVLKQGEIALAKVDVTQPDGTVAPTFVAKIGNDDTFANSPWLFAKASDVYGWAKAATKPAYEATEITRGEDKPSVEESIATLEAALTGTGSVAEAIKAAIEELDSADEAVAHQFVTAVTEADGKITVSRSALTADDIPELAIEKITGLTDKLAADLAEAKQAASDEADAAEAAAKGHADSLNTAMDARVGAIEADYTTAEQAGTIAQGKVDAFNTATVAPLAERVTAAETAITNETNRADAAEKALDERLVAAEAAIGALNAATTLEGVGALADRPSTGKAAGAIYIATDNNKEYVWDGDEWIELGDTTAELAAISALDDRATAIETSLSTGATAQAIATAQEQADKGVADAKTANDAIAAINNETTGILATAKGYTDEKIAEVNGAATTLEKKVDDHIADVDNPHSVTAEQVGLGKVENKTTAEIKTEFTGTIAEGNTGFVTGGDVYASVEGAKTAANGYTDGKVKEVADALAESDEKIATIETNYARVEGDALVYGQGEDVMTIIFDCGGAV